MSSPASVSAYPTLSVSEARAFMIAEIYQPRSHPLFSADTTARRPSFGVRPRLPSHYDNLADQVGRGNVMQRTHHIVQCDAPSTHTQPTPALPSTSTFSPIPNHPGTPDESIRRMFRRRSSVTYPTQFEDQYMSEPLY
ncbi:hypothetical protein B0H11DRAFT_1928643 [Mycena galericulata]|nr:hypothetical protein B0H11DRAFT_1928643 [Mycena galericulata]